MTADERLEVDIEKAFQEFVKATEEPNMRIAMERMRSLSKQRSPAQIERMEIAMGLR